MKRYTVIDVMKETQDGTEIYYSRAELIAAGVLVPVPDGDAEVVDRIPTGLRVALHGRKGVFRRVGSGAAANPLRSFLLFEDCNSGSEIEVEYGTLGTPVRLVKLGDVG